MANTKRVDKSLFESDHYLGKPADFSDLLVQRRLNVLRNHKGFLDKNANILEIGCGNGNTIIPLAGEFCGAIGLEYANVHSADFSQLKQDQNADNAHFVVWDIMTKPYEPLADRLISFEVIEHLPSEDGVANYVKSLKIGGIAAISVPNKWWIFETHGAKLPYLPWNRVPFFGWLPRPLHARWAHARIYTKRRICKLLEKHDFEIIETHLITAPMDVIRWKPFQKFLRRWIFFGDTTSIPFKAVSILVICRRKK